MAEARAVVAAARRHGRPRALAVIVTLGLLTALAATVSLSVGEIGVALPDVLGAAVGEGDSRDVLVVQELRLPRVLAGVVVGASLGMSGAVFQSLARNELASPDVIGITAGASTAVVLTFVLAGSGSVTTAPVALAGGLAAAVAIYLLAYRSGVAGHRLILVGIGIAAALTAVTGYLLTRAELGNAQLAIVWLTGSLGDSRWQTTVAAAVTLALCAPLLALCLRALRALSLGDTAAAALGVRVEAARGTAVALAVALASVATAAAGPVAFVALAAAPIARRMLRTGDVALLPAAFVGALLLTVADIVAREAFGLVQLPVGVLTGVLGAPYLLWLVARTNRAGASA